MIWEIGALTFISLMIVAGYFFAKSEERAMEGY